MLHVRAFLTGLFVLITAFLLALAPVGAKGASGGYQLFGGTESKLATGALDRQNGGDMLATGEAMKRYVNPVLAALTSGGDVGQYGTNLGIQSSQLANNYLSHADKRSQVIAQEKLDACNERGNCSAAEIEKLESSIAFFDDLDARTNAALEATCQDQSSSACRQEIKNAMVTMGIVSYPQEFPNGASLLPDGYTDLSNRLTSGADHYPEDVLSRNQTILNEYTDTQALLARYPVGVEGALTEFANESLAQGALTVIGGVSSPRLVGGKIQPKALDGAGNVNSTQIGGATKGATIGGKASEKVTWVDEGASMSSRAKTYDEGAMGSRSNIETRKGQAPALSRTTPDGQTAPVRFDGVDGDVMIDRKLSVVTTPKAKNQVLRQSEALQQNGLSGRWEVPTQSQANRAAKMFDELGVKNITVKVVPE